MTASHHRQGIWPVALVLAHAVLVSCSFNYEEASLEDELSEELPDTVLANAEHTVMRDGRLSVILQAARFEHYTKRDLIVLTDVYFRELDTSGQLVTEGWADAGLYYTDSENAEVSGNVVFLSHSEESGIYAARLQWDDAEHRLYSDEGEAVTVRRDDGSEISGATFDADLARRNVRFRDAAAGTLVVEGENADPAQ